MYNGVKAMVEAEKKLAKNINDKLELLEAAMRLKVEAQQEKLNEEHALKQKLIEAQEAAKTSVEKVDVVAEKVVENAVEVKAEIKQVDVHAE